MATAHDHRSSAPRPLRWETITRVQGCAADAPPEQWLLGTPGDVREQSQACLDVGITRIIGGVATPLDLEGLRHMAAEVRPAFR